MAVSLKYDLMRILLKSTSWGQGGTSGMGHSLSMLEALVEFPLRKKGRLKSKGQVINAAITKPGSNSGKPLYFQSNLHQCDQTAQLTSNESLWSTEYSYTLWA